VCAATQDSFFITDEHFSSGPSLYTFTTGTAEVQDWTLHKPEISVKKDEIVVKSERTLSQIVAYTIDGKIIVDNTWDASESMRNFKTIISRPKTLYMVYYRFTNGQEGIKKIMTSNE
jgi:hypothetical protein